MILRRSIFALGLHVAQSALVLSLGLAAIEVEPTDAPLVIATALGGSVAASRLLIGTRRAGAAAVATTWLLIGLVHHYAAGFDPRWSGRPVTGAAHVLWDLGFHLPPLLVALVATSRPPHLDRPRTSTHGAS